MSRQIEFAGKSGARYRYTPLEEDRFVPPAGANYVIAELTPEGPSVVYAGETDNLASQTASSPAPNSSADDIAQSDRRARPRAPRG